MKKLYIAIGIILLVFLAIGCSGSNNGSDNTQTNTATSKVKEPEAALTIIDSTLTPESYGGYSVKGSAIANKDLTYAQIDAQFFDKDDAVVYSSLTNVRNLKAGAEWKYKIIGPVDSSIQVATCNVTVGTCY